MDGDERSLTQAGTDILSRFPKLIDAISKNKNEHVSQSRAQLVDEFERFQLLAANLSLVHSGHSSLDYRLRESDIVYSTVKRFLEDLGGSLEEGFQLCQEDLIEDKSSDNPSQPYNTYGSLDGDFDEETELLEAGYGAGTDGDVPVIDLIVESITDSIDRLFRLATKIRNPSMRQIASRVKFYKAIDEETGINVIAEYAKYDQEHVEELFRSLDRTPPEERSRKGRPPEVIKQYLADRMSRANTFRRQQFGHWRRRRGRLQVVPQPDLQQSTPTTFPQLKVHLNTAIQSTDTPALSRVATSKPYTASMLDTSRLNFDGNQSTVSVSEYAPTTKGIDNETISWPLPPSKLKGQKFFECPYCFTLCASGYLEKRAWKAHLLRDIRPYICTYESCADGDRPYDTRQDWLDHESTHRRIWRCLEHASMVFQDRSSYQEHLRDEHQYEQHLRSTELVRAGESTSTLPDRPCPFCEAELASAVALQDHIAYHLERIAIFALPRSTGVEDESQRSGSWSGQAAGLNRSLSRDEAELESLGTFSGASSERSLAAPPAKIQVDNLHDDLTEEDITDLFERIAPVTELRMQHDRASRSRGTALVTYARVLDARTAIREFDGAIAKGQQIRLTLLPLDPRVSVANDTKSSLLPRRLNFDDLKVIEAGTGDNDTAKVNDFLRRMEGTLQEDDSAWKDPVERVISETSEEGTNTLTRHDVWAPNETPSGGFLDVDRAFCEELQEFTSAVDKEHHDADLERYVYLQEASELRAMLSHGYASKQKTLVTPSILAYLIGRQAYPFGRHDYDKKCLISVSDRGTVQWKLALERWAREPILHRESRESWHGRESDRSQVVLTTHECLTSLGRDELSRYAWDVIVIDMYDEEASSPSYIREALQKCESKTCLTLTPPGPTPFTAPQESIKNADHVVDDDESVLGESWQEDLDHQVIAEQDLLAKLLDLVDQTVSREPLTVRCIDFLISRTGLALASHSFLGELSLLTLRAGSATLASFQEHVILTYGDILSPQSILKTYVNLAYTNLCALHVPRSAYTDFKSYFKDEVSPEAAAWIDSQSFDDCLTRFYSSRAFESGLESTHTDRRDWVFMEPWEQINIIEEGARSQSYLSAMRLLVRMFRVVLTGEGSEYATNLTMRRGQSDANLIAAVYAFESRLTTMSASAEFSPEDAAPEPPLVDNSRFNKLDPIQTEHVDRTDPLVSDFDNLGPDDHGDKDESEDYNRPRGRQAGQDRPDTRMPDRSASLPPPFLPPSAYGNIALSELHPYLQPGDWEGAFEDTGFMRPEKSTRSRLESPVVEYSGRDAEQYGRLIESRAAEEAELCRQILTELLKCDIEFQDGDSAESLRVKVRSSQYRPKQPQFDTDALRNRLHLLETRVMELRQIRGWIVMCQTSENKRKEFALWEPSVLLTEESDLNGGSPQRQIQHIIDPNGHDESRPELPEPNLGQHATGTDRPDLTSVAGSIRRRYDRSLSRS